MWTLRRRPTLVCIGLAASQWGCSPAEFEVHEAREIGVVANAPDIVGRDGGCSSLLWGRSVWVYGDTVLLEDPSAWRYWTGDEWAVDPDQAETLFEGWVSMNVFYNAFLGRWMTVYSSVLTNDVVARTATELTGPWSDEQVLFVADRKGDDGWTYDAQVHTEYTEQSGKVFYVTYTRPNGNGWFGSETALWRVELE